MHGIFLSVMTLFSVACAQPETEWNNQANNNSNETVLPERKPNEVVWGTVGGTTVPLPPTEHPRVFLRRSDIPALMEKLNTPDARSIIRRIEKASVPRTPEEEASITDHGFRYYAQMRGVTSEVQLHALNHLLYDDMILGRKAVTAMLDTLKTTNFGTKNDLSRASGIMLMVGGLVYDWCYDVMTPGERQQYIKEFVRIAGTMECHYPPKRNESVVGHGSEWMILRDMLSCGIAIYDEYPDMYHHVIEMIYEDYIPVRNFTYKGQNYHQGSSYVSVRFTNDLNSLWILDRMGAGAIYDPAQQYVMYDLIYRRRPDGQMMYFGDENPAPRKQQQNYSQPAFLAASYYHDPYLAYEFDRRNKVEPHMYLLELLWRDFDLVGKAPNDLPLTRYSGTPFGWMIARTGWDSNCVIADMRINEHFYGNHQHLDGGSFQIYHKGPLAIDSGSYQGSSGGYNSPHNKNYFKRTIAHNSLLIYDPDEKFACWNYGGGGKTEFADNDGGQRMPGDRWESCRSFEQLLSEDYTVGKVLGHGFGPSKQRPEYSYLKGDITKAYTAKVQDVRRSFVFLNFETTDAKGKSVKKAAARTEPAALIVFDRVVASNPDFKKYWLLHSIEEPTIGESSFVVKRTKDGDSGMLRCNVLLPEADDVNIEKVGGPGKEFWVFGTNYANAATTRPDPCNERGEWRVEVTPKAAAAENLFLNVIQVADNSAPSLNAVSRVECGDRHVGVAIADRVVLFRKDGTTEREAFNVSVPAPEAAPEKGKVKLLVCDLAEGNWKVMQNGKKVASATVTAEEGTLYVTLAAGNYTITR